MAFGVSGSGDANISASRMAFNSADGSDGLGSESDGTNGSAVVSSEPATTLSTMCLRVTNRMRRVDRTRALVHANRPEAARLKHANEFQPNHLEQSDERDDESTLVVDVGEQVLEPHGFGLRQPREQLIDPHFHWNLLRRQENLRPHLGAVDDGLERRQEAEEIDFEFGLVFVARDMRDDFVRTLPLRRPQLLLLMQQAGRGFELLMLEQASHERVARILFFAFDTRSRLRTRKQHPRLDVNQRRRHDEKLAGDVEIQLLHQLNRVEILLRDERDGNVMDFHRVLLDEMEEQIERSLEVLELDGKCVNRRLEILVLHPNTSTSLRSVRGPSFRSPLHARACCRRTSPRAGTRAWRARRCGVHGSDRDTR